MSINQALLDKVEQFQNLLLTHATGGGMTVEEYQSARKELIEALGDRLPRFIRMNRDLHQLWPFIKTVSPTYQGRREFIWKEFGPLLNELEGKASAPGDEPVADALATLSSESVHSAWQTALQRRADDPDGAITAARTLLETVCKHILDDSEISYDAAADLPKLYYLTSESLNLAPSQHTEPILKQILGGCTAVVGGIGAMRNKLGDAHGKGKADAEPKPRHAELAVNLAGAAATFLVQTWEESLNG